MSSTSNNSHIFEKQFCDEYSIWKFYHREKQDKELAGPVPEVLSKENRDISAKMTKDLAIVGRGGARSSTLCVISIYSQFLQQVWKVKELFPHPEILQLK